MSEAAVKAQPGSAPDAERELTDGFHLIIDALKLNGLKTIYGVPGIPITDFGRMAQAAGIRVSRSGTSRTRAMPRRSPAS
jgi:oxalyl-CoA decarboxylase